jgi:hypothetical protein
VGSANGQAGAPFDDPANKFYNLGQLAGSRQETNPNPDPTRPPMHLLRDIRAGSPMQGTVAQRIPNDGTLVASGGSSTDGYTRFREALESAHDRVHDYIGGTIAQPHSAFEDPFVFLLHSNVDRLYASWQLMRVGIWEQVSWRLEAASVYGQESSEPAITELLQPWAGSRAMIPWAPPENQQESKTSLDRSVVAPPLYDTYAVPFNARHFSWNSLLVGEMLHDGDIIQTSIDLNAVASNVVEFVLAVPAHITWWKRINVPDGEGASWDIWTQDQKKSDTVSLWAHQVNNG